MSLKSRLRTAKCLARVYFPFVDRPTRAAAVRVRRVLRRPHQQSYGGIKFMREGLYLDIGANHGQSIESFRLFQPKADIHSFEILPHLAADLASRYPDVVVHTTGLGKEEGELVVYVPAVNDVLIDAFASTDLHFVEKCIHHHLRWHKGAFAKQFVCPVRTLDSFKLDPVFIKIDVEGAERDVVLGGLETIRRCMPVLLVEYGERVIDLLPPGYRLTKFVDGRFAHEGSGSDTYLIPQ